MLAVCVGALGADFITLAWDANSETNLVGYRVYAGTNSRQYSICIPTGLVTTQRVELPFKARWFFAVTATNAAGFESGYSAEVQWEPKPAAPVLQGESWVRLTPTAERSTNMVTWEPMALEPTLVPATNAQEFFRLTGLEIESLRMIK